MGKKHIGANERLWIAGEIQRLLVIAKDVSHGGSPWADNLIRNVYLWYWTADGIDAKGELKRDLFKKDTDFIRHTPDALKALKDRRKVTHEHAVPRKVLLQYLKDRNYHSPAEIKLFLDRFCFGVIIDKERDTPKLKGHSASMPTPFSETSNPLERYELSPKIDVLEPKNQRSD